LDNLVRILRSFSEIEEDTPFTEHFVDILKDMVMPDVQTMYDRGLTLKDNKIFFPAPWEAIYTSLKEIGFFKRFIPVNYGGNKTTEEIIYFIMELLGYTCPSLGIIFVAHSRAIDIVLAGENEAQKEKFLSRLRDVFNGEKTFVSNAGLASIYTILVNTRGKRGGRSLSVFVVEDELEGFSIGSLPEKDGLNILPTGRLIYEKCRVPKDNLVGDEGRGLLLALDAIDKGRILLAGVACGLGYRILDEVFQYSRKRIQFDHPLTSSQDISFKIADMHTHMNAARGLCFHALKQINTPYYRSASCQAKLFATSYFKNNIISLLSADARGMEYLEGTSSMQKMIISRELFKTFT